MFMIHESPDGVRFAVRVHPRAKKNAITGEFGEALKLSLTTPPVEGRANEACIEFFAKLLKVPRSSVTIASGQTSRNKVIRVAGVTAAEFTQPNWTEVLERLAGYRKRILRLAMLGESVPREFCLGCISTTEP